MGVPIKNFPLVFIVLAIEVMKMVCLPLVVRHKEAWASARSSEYCSGECLR